VRAIWYRAYAACVALSATGCQLLFGYDDFTQGEATRHACEELPIGKVDEREGVAMLRVDLPGGECTWIDRDEVTVDRYERWLSLSPAADMVWDEAFCAWKRARSAPQAMSDPCGADLRAKELQPFAPNKPVRCVDFCDAEAYCRWAGKRLCNDHANTGVQRPAALPREWTLSCSNGLQTVYPWGDEPDQGEACQVDHGEDSTVLDRGPLSTGTSVGCVNAVGVSDLLGNIAEWTYGCNVDSSTTRGQVTPCQIKGGGFDQPLASCVRWELAANDSRRANLGFRCCASLTAAERLQINEP